MTNLDIYFFYHIFEVLYQVEVRYTGGFEYTKLRNLRISIRF